MFGMSAASGAVKTAPTGISVAALPRAHHQYSMAKCLDIVQIVRRDDDGNAAVTIELTHKAAHRKLGDCFQTNGCRIEKEHRWFVNKRARQVAAHAPSQSKLKDRDLEQRLQVEQCDQLI
jgi:hypothetical protein